jgi:hypothetical protein
MPRMGFSDALAVVSIAATIVLLVLDKADKVKGPMLLVLLAIAAVLMLPIALGNSWVNSTSGMLKFSRGLLMMFVVGIGYSLLAIWISTGEKPEEVRIPASSSAPIPATGIPAPSPKHELANPTTLTAASDKLKLMFKDSPLFTPERRKIITKDVNGFAAYLAQLGIPIPNDIPPIGVDTANPKAAGWSFNTQSDNKYYYNKFTLQQGMLDDREKVTEAFCNFVIGRFMYKPPALIPNLDKITQQEFWDATHTPEQMDRTYRWMASVTLTQYLNHSYWNLPFAKNQQPVCPDQGTALAGEYFWRIRKQLGKEFADKLAIFTLRAVVDKPYEDSNQHYKQYFYERLKMADSVIDNENSRMPAIDAILKECGWLQV